MRLSEKTIELNICSQLSLLHIPLLIWFGLTQRQEAKAGFDACTKIKGRLILFQFKASNQDVGGKRRFRLNHDQLDNLRRRCQHLSRSVFYVFPLIGNSHELSKNSCFLTQTWLLDVSQLSQIPVPTKHDGTPRKSRIHYADVMPPDIIIHSDPIRLPLLSLEDFIINGFPGANRIQDRFDSFDQFWELCRHLARYSAAIIVPPEQSNI